MTLTLHPSLPVEVGLTAAIVAVREDSPVILVAPGPAGAEPALPSGTFDPLAHRTFEIGLRAWVAEQTGAPLGYVEQLYTFGDRGRHAEAGDSTPHVVSVGYLALTNRGAEADRLIGGASEVAARVEVHEMSLDGGVMKMREVAGGLAIKPGERRELKPGGHHLMLIGLKRPLKEGERFRVELKFEKAGAREVEFAVQGMGAAAPAQKHHHHH
jgi:copper(I)-binding protein